MPNTSKNTSALQHVYFVPGLAANISIFENIKLSEEFYSVHFLEWMIPDTQETLQDYAKRLCEKIKHDKIQLLPDISNISIDRVKKKLSKKGIKDFVIFHPSAQYQYKIYNQFSRDKLLTYLSSLGLSIVITGSNN